MRICIDGFAIPVLNWSLGGLALAKPCQIPLSPEQQLTGNLEFVVGGVNLSVKVALRLAHEQPDRFGFAFVDLTPEQMGMLRALLVRSRRRRTIMAMSQRDGARYLDAEQRELVDHREGSQTVTEKNRKTQTAEVSSPRGRGKRTAAQRR
jgi:hypothetical protein